MIGSSAADRWALYRVINPLLSLCYQGQPGSWFLNEAKEPGRTQDGKTGQKQREKQVKQAEVRCSRKQVKPEPRAHGTTDPLIHSAPDKRQLCCFWNSEWLDTVPEP